MFNQLFSSYYCSRLEIKGPILFNASTGGQELCLESLGFVLCTDAHLRTDILKGHRRTSSNRSLHWLSCLQSASKSKMPQKRHLTLVRRGDFLPQRQSPWLAGYWMSLLVADQPQQWGNTLGVSTQRSTHNTKNKSLINPKLWPKTWRHVSGA